MHFEVGLRYRIPAPTKSWQAIWSPSEDPIAVEFSTIDLRNWVYFCLAFLWAGGLLPRLGRCQNPKCQQFFLAKTQKKTVYCSQSCAQGKDAAARTKDYRKRRRDWENGRKALEKAMKQMQTLHETTERKALAQGESTLEKAEQTFQNAYRRGEGRGYEEGKELLAQASRQVKRLRKKVKGY